MRPFGAMVDEVQGLIQNTGSSYETKVKNALNRAYRRAVDMADWPDLRDEEDVTTTSENFFYLPVYVSRVHEILDLSNNRRDEPTFAIGRKFSSTYMTSGSGYRWSYAGYAPVVSQPSSASTISIKGDGGSDTGTRVYIVGQGDASTTSTGGAIFRRESVVTAGASAATTSATFAKLTQVTKEADASEDLIISIGATYLGILPKELYAARYVRIRLHYIPGSGTSFRVQFTRYGTRLIDDGDAPMIPVSDVMVYWASAELLREQKLVTQALALEAKAQQLLDQHLRAQLGQDRGGQQAIPSRYLGRTYV